MKSYNYEISEIANKFGANVQESTSNRNGYPSNLRPCIFGFDSIDEVEQAANELQSMINDDEIQIDVQHFIKRDGWHEYYRTGNNAYEMYDLEDECADDEISFRKDDANYYLNEERAGRLESLLEGDEDFDVDTFNKNTEKVHNAILNLRDGEILVINNDAWNDGYYEIRQQKAMMYHEDVWEYAIGISINW